MYVLLVRFTEFSEEHNAKFFGECEELVSPVQRRKRGPSVDAKDVCKWLGTWSTPGRTRPTLDKWKKQHLKCLDYAPQLYADAHGMINFDQLWTAVRDEVELRNFFEALDTNNDGKITKDELQTCIDKAIRISQMADEASAPLLAVDFRKSDVTTKLLEQFWWQRAPVPKSHDERWECDTVGILCSASVL